MRNNDLPAEYILLRDYLVENKNATIAAGGRECVVRCPFCKDSRNPNSKHLYIGINRNSNIISYHCFKCNASGSVNNELLRLLDITCMDQVLSYNKELGVNTFMKVHYNTFTDYIDRSIVPIYDTKEYNIKLDYINKRIGGKLTLGDAKDYSIIFNLKDYLNANNIYKYSRDERIVEQLSKYFVGFLSVDGSHVILRRLVNENKVHESLSKRYTKYTIRDKGSNIYCIREGIDQKYRNVICIAEGPFDILSIHYNLIYCVFNKTIFASCGKGVDGVLEYLLKVKRFGFINTEIHVYIDNDITSYDLESYKKPLRALSIPFYIHSNAYNNEKDYGVPKERIIDRLI